MIKKRLHFPSSDGKHKLYVCIWKPDSDKQPTGILQIAHGMTEHIEYYNEFASFMADHGWIVIGNDHLGHGHTANSKTEFGYFDKRHPSKTVVRDLHALSIRIRRSYPELPFYVLGHSMGSFLMRRYIIRYGTEIDGALFLGSGSKPQLIVTGGRILIWFIKLWKGPCYRSDFVSNLALKTGIKKESDDYVGDWRKKDTDLIAKHAADPYSNYIFTLNGFEMLLSTIAYIQKKKNIAKIPKNLPILFLSGTEDPIGDYGNGIKKACSQLRQAGLSNVKMKLYKGDRHEILNELDKEIVYSDILNWLSVLTSV